MHTHRQPTFFIPHGGGPCFFMDDPRSTWTGMAAFLRSLPARLPAPPKAILVVSGHWETKGFCFTGSCRPSLIYDYYNFPAATYALRYDVPGAPELAQKAAKLLLAAGLPATVDPERGLDHGVFIPLKVAFPDATIPVVEMSVEYQLDPKLHSAAGNALSSLRDHGVLIVGSGMSFHNLRGYNNPQFTTPSEQFDAWLADAANLAAPARAEQLARWQAAPAARLSHPREEHLIPLMVAAGASTERGERLYSERVLQTAISAFRFQ